LEALEQLNDEKKKQ
jgi:DNA invertase Pin-like site-specific DNA recombinase